MNLKEIVPRGTIRVKVLTYKDFFICQKQKRACKWFEWIYAQSENEKRMNKHNKNIHEGSE